MRLQRTGHPAVGGFSPEDTVRFYSLRFKEVGMLKKRPSSTDRAGDGLAFPQGLKKELKGQDGRGALRSSSGAAPGWIVFIPRYV